MENATATNNAHAGVDQIGEKLGRIKTDIQDVVGLTRSLAGEKISGYSKTVVKGGKDAIDSITTSIEDHPIRTALIAAGIGAVVGFLIRRR